MIVSKASPGCHPMSATMLAAKSRPESRALGTTS